MKRMICMLLLLTLLCACSNDEVPVYQQETIATQPTTEPISVSDPKLPDGESMLHLNTLNMQYQTTGSLRYFDEELQKWSSFCTKGDCAHYDESCPAWVAEGNVRIAVKDGICYYVDTDNSSYGLQYFDFCALNLDTLERKSYFKVQAQENERIFLGNAALCGDKAILNYSIQADEALTMQQYIQVLDLQTEKIITVMNREIQNGEVYEIWGMNESHIIVSYLHTGMNESFAANESNYNGLPNHVEFMMDQHRWVLLEFPIQENATWSEQVAEYVAGSDLRLFNHSNFYRGTMYYVLNDSVRGYDLKEHKNARIFEQKGIVYMSCLDGKILYLTDENRSFSFDLESGTTQEIKQTEWFPIAESENYFYCKKVSAGQFSESSCIAKSEYYS